MYKSKKKILNIEIFDLHKYIFSLNKETNFLSVNLSNLLPSHIWNEILKFYSDSFMNSFINTDYLSNTKRNLIGFIKKLTII